MADAVQTTFTQEPAIGMPGMIYDSGEFHDIITLIAQEDIPFGVFVKQSGMYCELPDATGEVTGNPVGVSVLNPATRASGVGYKAGDPVAVMKTGRVWVLTEQAIANNASPFVRFASGAGGTQKGALRNDADTATAVQVASGVHMYRGVGGAGLAVVELGKTGD